MNRPGRCCFVLLSIAIGLIGCRDGDRGEITIAKDCRDLIDASLGDHPFMMFDGGDRREAAITKRLPKSSPMPGLLTVHPDNSAYFQDTSSDRAIFLHGFDHFRGLQEYNNNGIPPLDFSAFLDRLKAYDHNFLRLWVWEHFWQKNSESQGDAEGQGGAVWPPHVYRRTGPGEAVDGLPKFDLRAFNEDYFERLRARVIEAGTRGIWVSVMLFQGWSIQGHGSQAHTMWQGHPFNSRNNINGIDGDFDGDGNGWEVHTRTSPDILALQEAYVKKVIETVGDLDHVLYEISNESVATETSGRCHHVNRVKEWAYAMIDFIHRYEREKGYGPHPVGMSGFRQIPKDPALRDVNPILFESPAEYISPTGSRWGGDERWKMDPPPATGQKVVIADTDHIHPAKHGGPGMRSWQWRVFTRGHSLNAVDGDPEQGADWVTPEDSGAMQMMDRLAAHVELASMKPHPDLSSTTFCLAHPGTAYIVYQPRKGVEGSPRGFPFEVNLAAGSFRYEWFNPETNQRVESGDWSWGGGLATFTPPFNNHAVLFLYLQ